MNGGHLVTVGAAEAGLRLDRWFKRHYQGLSHARLSRLLRTGQVRVDGARVRAGHRLEAGQRVRVPPLGEGAAPPRADPAPIDAGEATRLRRAILHVDDAVIAINKPSGLAVQGGSGTHRHLDAMLDALRLDAAERPRLVHRLDKDTSGVLVLARDARAAAAIAAAFRRREAHKLYWALVRGVPRPPSGEIRLALGKVRGPRGEQVAVTPQGKSARTSYETIERAGRRLAWLALTPLTGRTHQLRAHCAALGTPILGDRKYDGGRGREPRVGPSVGVLCLHARAIALPHPDGGELRVVAPLPEPSRNAWERFGFEPGSAEARAPCG